jgi:hypothetical protein
MNPSEFKTRDIYLATALRQSGAKIVRVENHTGKGIFVFKSSPTIEKLTTDFFNGDLRVDPQGLFEAWKSLKSMAYSTIGNVR